MNFVRPGLNIQIVSAKIATDGTISLDYKITDPDGLPLDPAGIQTPGAISVSFPWRRTFRRGSGSTCRT